MSDAKATGKRKGKPQITFETFFNYTDSNGNEVRYDGTGKSKDEFPEELKAAINAASDELYRTIIIPTFLKWVDGLPPDEAAMIRDAANSDDPAAQKALEELWLTWNEKTWRGSRTEEK